MSVLGVGASGTVELCLTEDETWDLVTLLRFRATEQGLTIEDQHYWEDIANKVEEQLREQI